MSEAHLLECADELLAACPPESTDPKVFLRAQYDAGLAVGALPRGYGGSDASIDLQPVVDDRLAAADAPPNGRMFNAIGAGQCAATVLVYGSEEQKRHYLPLVFTGEAEWCQLFSEPGSGSDLASLATRPCATATNGCSTARRSGPAARAARVRRSCSHAPIPTRRSTPV